MNEVEEHADLDEISKLKSELALLLAEEDYKDKIIESLNTQDRVDDTIGYAEQETSSNNSSSNVLLTESSTAKTKFKQFVLQYSNFTKPGDMDESPQFYINKLLAGPEVLSLTFLKKLTSIFQTANSDWLSDFIGLNGLSAIERAFIAYETSNADFKLILCQCELINCLVAFTNNKVAIQYVVNDAEQSMTSFAKLLFTSKNILFKVRLLELLAAVALYSETGHRSVLQWLGNVEKQLGNRVRFHLFVKLMYDATCNAFKVNCMALVNCIVSSPPKIQHRLILRHYFIQAGLLQVVKELEQENAENPNKELSVQIRAFQEQMDEDNKGQEDRIDTNKLEYPILN